MEDIKSSICHILPSLAPEAVQSLIEHMITTGVESKSDLSLLHEGDLLSCLKPIQCRKLLMAWKQAATPVDNEDMPSTPCASPSTSISIPRPCISPSINPNWSTDFDIPWGKCPPEVMTALRAGQRPTPRNRRCLVRVIVDEVYRQCKRPQRRQLAKIAQAVVISFPKSLEDSIGGNIVGSGYDSFLNQMVCRVENLNRTSPLTKLKRKDSDKCASTTPHVHTDSYGCVNWLPDAPPSTDDQVHKREAMVEQWQQGVSYCDAIQVLLDDTYYLQRVDIVGGSSTCDLQHKWPYLYTSEGMLRHAKMLVGVDIVAALSNFIEVKGDLMSSFLSESSKKSVLTVFRQLCVTLQRVDVTSGHCKTAAIFLAIMAEFGETSELLFLEAKETTTRREAEQLPNLPETPCLVICGESLMTAKRTMLAIDRVIVTDHIEEIIVSLAVLFAAYFVFNIRYPVGGASTLEFIQRCCVHINPETGSKIQRAKRKKTIHASSSKVLNLINGLSCYSWTHQ